MIYFTADLHLGHANIIKHCNRPFKTVHEMDITLLKNINVKVRENDTLYIVGDFAWWKCKQDQLRAYRSQILCKNIHLLLGNHDYPIKNKLLPLFSSVEDIKSLKIKDQKIILCHYAMRTWNCSHHGAYHLYGHSHNNLRDDPYSLSFDIGVDGKDYNFSPLCFPEIQRIMEKKHWTPPFKDNK